jgi:DNA-binding NtrC family response regulator
MRLLIIGEFKEQIVEASVIAKKKGANVESVENIESALEFIREGNGVNMILIDVKKDIAMLVRSLLAEHIVMPIIACGINDNAQDAVKAIKAGAIEYIPLPPDEELIAAVLEMITSESDTRLVYKSAEMKKVMHIVGQVAPSEANILITGESGTGKEVISRQIHNQSARKNGAFIAVNCAAIPDNLLESELFGHEKGAFTGAVSRRIGRFEEANNGTLLLDEISEMDIRLQAKLLRAIQEREIDRVGGSAKVKLNLRILATSNRNLQEEVKAGNFREDLFFRLNIINIILPPLRKRQDDIDELCRYFIDKYAKLNGVPIKKLSNSAFSKIHSYKWPGNIRELENTMHRSVLMSMGEEIDKSDLLLDNNDTPANEESNGMLVGRTVESVEKELIVSTLEHCSGNRTHAANVLGISIRTLRNKLNAYDVSAN